MFFTENPALQRELLVNLRMGRAFLLLLLYQVLLGAVVLVAWPHPEHGRLDLTRSSQNAQETRALVNLFFQGQFILASLMAPSFAAGTITGEKERHTYEMLLASPLHPSTIVWGKLVASLAHLAILIFASLPIVMLCLPLGGVQFFELLAAYFALLVSVVTFGMISVACSAYFQRTSAALVVSYFLILPLAILGAAMWQLLEDMPEWRFFMILVVLPIVAGITFVSLFWRTSRLLLYPPDVGSEGKEVVDLARESETAVGLVIQRDQFPDRLFAPEERVDLLPDQANPVLDKETRNEIFAQGTLMLRLVIQVSMLLAIPIMAATMYFNPEWAPWYIAYVIVFNMLIGPVFSAGSVTSERERETLDLLLTTTITPWQILWGKLVASLRVSVVLTMFLVWPIFLSCLMVSSYWPNLLGMLAFLLVIVLTCLTTTMIGLFCSVLFHKTATSLMTTYITILLLFTIPVAVRFFADTFYPDRVIQQVLRENPSIARSPEQLPWTPQRQLRAACFVSPFEAVRSVPFNASISSNATVAQLTTLPNDWRLFAAFSSYTLLLNLALFGIMMWLFHTRWRVSMN
jgi:ABC-type transport system involved in multi-copper enzyme maturation permease subunit